MYPLNLGDIVQINVFYQQPNVLEMMNVFHYRHTGTAAVPDGATELQIILADWFTSTAQTLSWAFGWQSFGSAAVSIVQTNAQKIWPTRFVPVVNSTIITGSNPIDPLTPAATPSIVKRSIRADRHGTGNTRPPGMPEEHEANGLVVGAGIINLENLAQKIPEVIQLTTNVLWTPIIFNRSEPNLSPEITSAEASNTIRTQRTRIPFRGI